jgi:mono/diheme cytochrome c family protein
MTCVVATLAVLAATAQDKTAEQGVYTAPQAARGEAVYRVQCETCHREAGVAPVLTGELFARSFGDATLQSLFTTIKTTMPRNAPASLSDGDYTDIVAHLLKMNGYPDGATELSPADLAAIRIPGRASDLEFALIQSVGCLEQQGRTWTLSGATEPARTREPAPAGDDEAARLDGLPTGERAFLLQQVYGAPAGWTGQRVAVKGFFSRAAGGDRITVSSMRVLTGSCQK